MLAEDAGTARLIITGDLGIAAHYCDTVAVMQAGRIVEINETERLFDACRKTLDDWTEILRARAGDRFPEKVTAFHDEMAAHGRYRQPCPVCGAPIQRIVHAENESNYCARCQTGGRVLADRSLSKLLKETWPRRIEELEGIDSGSARRRAVNRAEE